MDKNDLSEEKSDKSFNSSKSEDTGKGTDVLEKTEDLLTADDILQQLGGCGRMQIILVIIIQSMKLVVCWGMQGNSFLAYVPDWRCVSVNSTNISITSATHNFGTSNETVDDEKFYWNKYCKTYGDTECNNFEFDPEIKTIVSEFGLVCNLSWVTATITSLQMAGMCLGSLISGQLSDLFGRKIPTFTSVTMLFVFQLIAYFSTSWIMFAVCKFFIGIGSAFFLTLYGTHQSEYALSKWRSIIISFPSWAIESALFTLVAWQLQNWKHITLIIAIVSAAYLVTWFFVPESFRWLVAKGKHKEAKKTIDTVARWNQHRPPDYEHLSKAIATQNERESSEKYSILVLFRRRELLRLTIAMVSTWLTLGCVSYGINFGIKQLSGNIYLNILIFSVASIPSKLLSMYLQNRFGRKAATIFFFSLCFVGGMVVGIAQYVDVARDQLTLYFALLANIGVDGAWGPVQTHEVELYPTVIRNTAFGFHSIFSRLGAVIGPQFVYLGEFVPGLLYFIVAGLSFLSIVGTFTLPETMGTVLLDTITDDMESRRKKENFTNEKIV